VTDEGWKDPRVQEWSRWLLDSHRHWTGRDLIERKGSRGFDSQALFNATIVVVSHGTESDPILNYGNRTALGLWELTWEQLLVMPSRLTAEPVNRAERERMLEAARRHGYHAGYRGVRITSSGRRFLVENALVWTVLDPSGNRVGQAATFATWEWLS
jgi:hypothetical protein